jgi:glucose/arabinose dehydrogenase
MQLAASTTPATATVTYSAGTGGLTITITGLATGVSAAVTVTGPSGYSQQLTGTQTLTSLTPGAYTITASPVATNLTTHHPTPATQNVTVTAGATATRTVTYAASPLVLGVQQVTEGLASPVYLTAPANDARLFIVEQPGQIRIFKNGALLATPFLDITSIVQYGGEQGLLSVAFDPAYATNGRFYVYYTDNNGDIAVARYTAAPTADVANAGSRTSVITIPHPGQSNHNGGLAMFGPDGMLYLGTGDGGGSGDPQNNAQNINSLLGKLLRLNVANLPYTIPAGNPFVGVAGADEIWAFGLRNPWRYAFDAVEDELYIADVGQDFWEEVNVMPAMLSARNYGWRIMEGTHCHNPAIGCNPVGLTLPVHEYSHSEGCSITGGFVYRGAAIAELRGHYLYSDWCTGFLRSFRMSGGSDIDHRNWSIGNIGNILSFGVDAAGELYMLSATGRVYRIVRG